MTDVKWIKIVTDIFDDEKILLIESMPDADSIIVIWFKLLCLAGKNNNNGVFLLNERIHYTDEMFATIFRRPLNTVRMALKTFEEFGMIEIINDTVTIPNWEKHQQLDALEMAREATRQRVARHREKQKALASGNVSSNVTDCVTEGVTEGVTETPSNGDRIDKIRIDKNNNILRKCAKNDEPPEFLEFYNIYPRHRSKQDAIKAFRALKPNENLLRIIIDDIQHRIAYGGEWYKKDEQYIPYPAKYLRGKMWEDELSTQLSSTRYTNVSSDSLQYDNLI